MRKITRAEQDRLLAVVDRHRAELMALDGVHDVDVGYEYAGGGQSGRLAIRLHVRDKRPESQLESSQLAPTEIEDIPVDVLQTNPEPHGRDDRADPIMGGFATTNSTRLAGSAGTVGAVVFDRRTGPPMVLSNHHVLVGPTGAAGDVVNQPRSRDLRDQIGALTRWDESLDCAVATLNGSRAAAAAILDYPQGVELLEDPLIGTPVTKSGRTTATTFGVIDGVTASGFTVVRIRNGRRTAARSALAGTREPSGCALIGRRSPWACTTLGRPIPRPRRSGHGR